MYTIVGLGNPGKEYENTRHNAGVRAAEAFAHAHAFRDFVESGKFAGLISEGVIDGNEVRILIPTTFMNKSGISVQKALANEGALEKLIVLHDELDLPLGSFKISKGRGNAGHNGVQSIIDALGTNEFTRVRIGVSPVSIFGNMKRPTGPRVGDFVLKDFSRGERAKFERSFPDIIEAVKELLMKEGEMQ